MSVVRPNKRVANDGQCIVRKRACVVIDVVPRTPPQPPPLPVPATVPSAAAPPKSLRSVYGLPNVTNPLVRAMFNLDGNDDDDDEQAANDQVRKVADVATPLPAPPPQAPQAPPPQAPQAPPPQAPQAAAGDDRPNKFCSQVPLLQRLCSIKTDCYRCQIMRDGIWHTLTHAVPFFERLWSFLDEQCEGDGAEKRWYDLLESAGGIKRGEECSALCWPLQASSSLSECVHPLARCLVQQLCRAPSNGDFIDHIVMPTLLCMHHMALSGQTTLRSAETSFALEKLRTTSPNDAAAEAAALRDLIEFRGQLPYGMSVATVANVCCAFISAPSRRMPVAFCVASPKRSAAFINMPDLPLAALPINLRKSINEDAQSPRAASLHNYAGLFGQQ